MPLLQSQLPVANINESELDQLTAPAELIVADLHGPKVMQLKNGNMIKLFRRKRWFSSALFAPYGIRFVNNAFRLKELGIPTITPVNVRHCAAKKLYIVEYIPLPGDLLRGLLESDEQGDLFKQAAEFIATLHNKGIYFRSLHFENVVYDGTRMGLIDIADMKIYRKALNHSHQQRNFQHFMRYPQDAKLINEFGEERFRQIYQQSLTQLF